MLKMRKSQWILLGTTVSCFLISCIFWFSFQASVDAYNNKLKSIKKKRDVASLMMQQGMSRALDVEIIFDFYIDSEHEYYHVYKAAPKYKMTGVYEETGEIYILVPDNKDKIVAIVPEFLRAQSRLQEIDLDILDNVTKKGYSWEFAAFVGLSQYFPDKQDEIAEAASFSDVANQVSEGGNEFLEQMEPIAKRRGEIQTQLQKLREQIASNRELGIDTTDFERQEKDLALEVERLKEEGLAVFDGKGMSAVTSGLEEIRKVQLKKTQEKLLRYEFYSYLSVICMSVSLLSFTGGIIIISFFHKNRYPNIVRELMRNNGCDDEEFGKKVQEAYANEWLTCANTRDVIREIEQEFQAYKRRLNRLALEEARRKQKKSKPELPKKSERKQKPDKRQVRTQKRRLLALDYNIPSNILDEEAKSVQADDTTTLDDEDVFLQTVDLVTDLQKLSITELDHLDQVPASRLSELKKYLPEFNVRIPKRLRRCWANNFDGRDETTFMPLIKLLRHNKIEKWDQIKELIIGDESRYLSPPILTQKPQDFSIFAGKTIVIYGGRERLSGEYRRLLKLCKAKKVVWIPGAKQPAQVVSRKADIIICLFYGLSHATSNRIRCTLGENSATTRIIFSANDGRSRFLDGITQQLN